MPTRVVQLSVNFLPSFASVDPTDISYEIVSGVDTVHVEETGEGVRGDGNGSFSVDVAIDDAWHPCRVIWYGPGRSISEPIDEPASGGSGSSPADIWNHHPRTLSNFPVMVAYVTPQAGVGAFIPGGRPEQITPAARISTIAGAAVVLLARVVGVDGDYITPDDVESITLTTLNLADEEDADTTEASVEDCVSDTLIQDGRWTEDAAGYNFSIVVAGDRLSAAGTTYRMDVTLTDGDGNDIVLRWEASIT